MESDICDIFNKNKSGKDYNGVLQLYHTLFQKARNEKVVVVEIGATLETLKSWREYWPEGRIVGISGSKYEGYEVYQCETNNTTQINDVMIELGKVDIIIDNSVCEDTSLGQIMTLRNMYPWLKDGGYYIIEKINKSSNIFKCPSLIGSMCNHDCYFFVGLQHTMCVIQKVYIASKRGVY